MGHKHSTNKSNKANKSEKKPKDFKHKSNLKIKTQISLEENSEISALLQMRNGDLLIAAIGIPHFFLFDKDLKLKEKIECGKEMIRYFYEMKKDNIILSTSDNTLIKVWDMNEDVYELMTIIKTNLIQMPKIIQTKNNNIIVCSWNNTITVFGEDYNQIEVLKGHMHYVKSIIEIKNNILVSASSDFSVRFWDLNNFKSMEELKIEKAYCSSCNSLIYDEDLDVLLVGGRGRVCVISIKERKVIKDIELQLGMNYIYNIIQLSNGNFLINTRFNTIGEIDRGFNLINQTNYNEKKGGYITRMIISEDNIFYSGDSQGIISKWIY